MLDELSGGLADDVPSGARVVSIHCGLNERTRGRIDGAALALLRRGTVFVNTARGPIVDEVALVARARIGDVVFALDVFDEEPLSQRHPLRRIGNVLLTPHSASKTPDRERHVGAQALDIISAWRGGHP